MSSKNIPADAAKFWLVFANWLESAQSVVPKVWPSELPHETATDFWFIACKYEMSTRDSVSEKLRLLVGGQALPSISPLEGWMIFRRVEWASQLGLAKAQQGVIPPVPLSEVLEWALIATWQSDGCQGMWKHAERGGLPHPENPDGLSPLR